MTRISHQGDNQNNHPDRTTISPYGSDQKGHRHDNTNSSQGDNQEGYSEDEIHEDYHEGNKINDKKDLPVKNRKKSHHKKKKMPIIILPPKVIDGVRKFVLFLGSGRSGSSILGSIMDAHPNVVIAHQLLNRGFEVYASKTALFNALYSKSVNDASGSRGSSQKGYSLGVEGLWQGSYDKHIEVIGDKCGGRIITSYSENRDKFLEHYRQLQNTLSIPIKPIRNPFDMIASLAFAKTHKYGQTKAKNETMPVKKQVITIFLMVGRAD